MIQQKISITIKIILFLSFFILPKCCYTIYLFSSFLTINYTSCIYEKNKINVHDEKQFINYYYIFFLVFLEHTIHVRVMHALLFKKQIIFLSVSQIKQIIIKISTNAHNGH